MRRWLIGLLVALVGCAGESSSSTPVVPDRTTTTGRPLRTTSALPPSATCGDYLDATEPEREVATQAALMVAREAAGGVSRAVPEELRALFEITVGLLCDRDRSAQMLTTMAIVVAADPGYLE